MPSQSSLDRLIVLAGVISTAGLVSLTVGSVVLTSFRILPDFQFSFGSFVSTFQERWFAEAFWNTIIVGTLGTAIAFAFGTPFAWLVTRTDLPFRGKFETFSLLGYFLTRYTTTMGYLLLTDVRMGLIFRIFGTGVSLNNVWGMALITGFSQVPLFVLYLTTSLKSLDSSLEEAAKSVGCGERSTIMRITLPVIAPSLFSALLLTFVLSIEDFIVPLLVGAPSRIYTLTTRLYYALSTYPASVEAACVLAVVMLAISMPLVLVVALYLRKKTYVTIGGRGFIRRETSLGKLRMPGFVFCLICILLTFLIPIGVTSLYAFVDMQSLTFTFDNFQKLMFGGMFAPLFQRGVQNTLILAFAGATIATLLGLLLSYGKVRVKRFGASYIEVIVALTLGTPGIVIGLGTFWSFLYMGIAGTSLLMMIVATTVRHISHPVRAISSAWGQIDETLEEAAASCGSSFLRTFATITAPLLKPGIFAAWVMSFVIFVKEVSALLFIWTSSTMTLSIVSVTIWENGTWGEFMALQFLLLPICIISLLASRVLTPESFLTQAG